MLLTPDRNACGAAAFVPRAWAPERDHAERLHRTPPEGSAGGLTDRRLCSGGHADHVLHTSKPQRAAIEWARKEGHKPLVARVRHLNNKKNPDHWREA